MSKPKSRRRKKQRAAVAARPADEASAAAQPASGASAAAGSAGKASAAARPASEAPAITTTASIAPVVVPRNGATPRAATQEEVAGRDAHRAGGFADGVHDVVRRSGFLSVAAIARHDLAAMFVSPLGWLVAAGFALFVSAFGFVGPVVIGQLASIDGVFHFVVGVVILVTVPLLTMRAFAEEVRRGTLELLVTSPVRGWELTLGKWLGAFIFYALLVMTTLVYVALLAVYIPDNATVSAAGITGQVGNLDPGLVAAAYAGMVLAGAAATAVGTLASSLTRNQVAAFLLAGVSLVVIWYGGYLLSFIAQPPASTFFDYISAYNRFQAFSLGELTLKDAAYFLTLTVGALFLTTRLLESRRWR